MSSRYTLKNIISDTLRARGFISRAELKDTCRKYGYEESNGERRMRKEKNPIPHIKLNILKKPCKINEWVAFYKWDGGKTKFKTDYEQKDEKTRKTQTRKKTVLKGTHEKTWKTGSTKTIRRQNKRGNK